MRAKIIDLLFILVFLSIIYQAQREGFVGEFFKALGILAASLVAFHFYSSFPLQEKLAFFLNKELYQACVFTLLFVGIRFIFFVSRKFLLYFFKKEKYLLRERLSASVLGVFRFSITCSVLIFIFYLGGWRGEALFKSLSYPIFKNIAPAIYLNILEKAKIKFNNLKANKEVVDYYAFKETL